MTSVADFGAAGDGITDDTEAIQHAIDEAIGRLSFPRGVYRITKSILVDLEKIGWTALDGQSGTARIEMEGAGPAIILRGNHQGSADPKSYQEHTWSHERMPMVRDLEIIGKHPEADGILITGATQPTIVGVLLRQLRNGIRITGRARNVLIDHCHIYYNLGIGIHLEDLNLHQTIISSSHISYCRLGGIRIERSEIRNLQITGNDIEYNNNRAHGVEDADGEPTAEIYLDARVGSIREGTICSNTIQATYSPNGANIRMIGQGEDRNPQVGMWTISGNLIGSQWNNIHLTAAQGVTITGNYIYSGHNRNLLVEDSIQILVGDNCFGHNADYGQARELCTGVAFHNSRDCILNGNLLQDCQSGRHLFPEAPELQREALLELFNCRNITISNSQILDSAPYGIRLHETSDVTLSAVTVADRRDPCLQKAAVYWTGAAGNSIITACRFGPSLDQSFQSDSELTLHACHVHQP
ncbi:MAG: right-handed parallel beta-helix repeat-containing protein [Planctomycetaceae bacterium]|nr:right-handed parallel beta-helix repeat-containing protein [Planctomycetaceae bacterium]